MAPSHSLHEPPDRGFDIVRPPDAFVAVGANDDQRRWPLASTPTVGRSVTARTGQARPVGTTSPTALTWDARHTSRFPQSGPPGIEGACRPAARRPGP